MAQAPGDMGTHPGTWGPNHPGAPRDMGTQGPEDPRLFHETESTHKRSEITYNRAGTAGMAGTVLAVPLFSRLGAALVYCS